MTLDAARQRIESAITNMGSMQPWPLNWSSTRSAPTWAVTP